MDRLRKLARLLTVAALGVVLAVTTSQILTDNALSWAWLYVSLAIAVLAAIYAEVFAADHPRAAAGRRSVYLRQLRASVEEMEIVGIVTQSEFVLRTKQVYVDVSLTRKPRHETPQEPYVGAVTTPVGERRTLASFLEGDESRVLAVIGGPGTGKTTLARSTALDLSATGWRRRPLPILLYLRDHKSVADENPPGLAEVAASVGWLHGKVPAAWIERRLDRGGCVVLLDGLDEVADEADGGRVVTWVKRQIERYPDNRYVLTSRPHGYHSNPLPTAEVLQVRRFTGEQISQFLHGWSYAIERRASESTDAHVREEAARKADDLLDRLRRQPALYDLAANPLLLTMIANVHRYRGQLPGSRAALYAEMCDVLLHRRSEVRDLANATGLRGPQKERVMRHLALTMMRDRIRDIPADAAHRAIREPLRQVSRDVTSETFLEEARKSGLLVEREQGIYAFAHLTLQEYLAAAQIGQQHVNLLTAAVDDPWWRETTLLWAADADASPVIEACMAWGTVRALVLALDCADEAAEANPYLHEWLNGLPGRLNDRQLNEPSRQLIYAVVASRALAETISLGDTTLCARPVPFTLYRLFENAERAAGLHHPGGSDSERPRRTAVGMWAVDATRFVPWLNDLFNDGTAYRLPTPDELADPAVDLIIDRTRHTVWAHTDSGPRLHARDGMPWPYTPDAARIPGCLSRDREVTGWCLSLASLTLPDPPRALRFWDAFAPPTLPPPGHNRDLELIELILALHLANEVATRVRGWDALGIGVPLAIAQRFVRLERPTDDMARDIAVGIDRVREGSGPIGPEFSRLLDRARHLASTLITDVSTPLAYELALRESLGVNRLREHAFGPFRGGDPEVAEPQTAINGFAALLATWTPSTRSQPSAVRRGFDALLAGILSGAARAPEHPVLAIDQAREWITGHNPGSGSCSGPGLDPLVHRALALTRGVIRIVTPILDRTAPFERHPLACARIGLLAAIALLRRAGAHPPVRMLEEALCGLIALQQRADGELAPNEVLLLARARE